MEIYTEDPVKKKQVKTGEYIDGVFIKTVIRKSISHEASKWHQERNVIFAMFIFTAFSNLTLNFMRFSMDFPYNENKRQLQDDCHL